MVSSNRFYATLCSTSMVYSKWGFYDKLDLAHDWYLVVRKMFEYPVGLVCIQWKIVYVSSYTMIAAILTIVVAMLVYIFWFIRTEMSRLSARIDESALGVARMNKEMMGSVMKVLTQPLLQILMRKMRMRKMKKMRDEEDEQEEER